MELDTVRNTEPAQPMVLDAAMRGATDDAVDLVAVFQQKLGEISAVLPRDARDQRFPRHIEPLSASPRAIGRLAPRRHGPLFQRGVERKTSSRCAVGVAAQARLACATRRASVS